MENDESNASLDPDVPLLVRFFTDELRSVSDTPKKGMQATIFRVPENIRRTNVDSFEPKMVSLGPYHHGKQLFRATDVRIKLPYASNFFSCMGVDKVQQIVERFKDWESDLRCAYSEQIIMTSYEFVQMMLLDCAFLAQFLLDRKDLWCGTETENYLLWKWAAPSIVNDMLVVENQLPLRPLFYLLNHCRDDSPPLSMKNCFGKIMWGLHRNLSPLVMSDMDFSSICQTSAHWLHLFHSYIVGMLRDKPRGSRFVQFYSFPSAEMLQATRIQFTNKTDGRCFLDITFDERKRSMEIPELHINDDNVSLLRNLIAFEQQCRGVDKWISTYVWFMDCLINTGKDVAVLRKHNIIISRLRSDEEVAHIFNKLRRTDVPVVDSDNFYLEEVMFDVLRHCSNRPNRFWALWNLSWLRQNYFKNRWVTIGVTAAVFFNLLTLVQTVYAVLSYAKQ